MKFHIETYGCTSNFGNSNQVEEALISLGHMPSAIEEADAVIVNTCAVTGKTESKMLKRLRLLQGNRLIIAGCLLAAVAGSVEQISCRMKMGVLNRSAGKEIAGSVSDDFSGKASLSLIISAAS